MPSTDTGLATRDDMPSLAPQGTERATPDVPVSGEFSDAALRCVRLALEGATDGLTQFVASMTPAGPADRCLQAFALAVAGVTPPAEDGATADTAGNPVVAPLDVLTKALQGRFGAAAAALRERVGEDWTRATPLYRLLGLLVASGHDIARAQELEAVTPLPPPDRTASLITALIAARVDLVLGRRDSAAARYAALVGDCEEAGLFGAVSLVAFDALEATRASSELPQIRFPDVPLLGPVRDLADALRRGDLEAAAAAAQLQPPGTYRQARALFLVGREGAVASAPTDAHVHLARAVEVFEAVGAPVDADRTRQIIRGLPR
ncbi:MAG: hypothetical protein IT198_15780 [Acidimicrobiia bacterium]|nr:hypothetical protein [Acidimicrobiia bacterium]